jgi:hypothetical protein
MIIKTRHAWIMCATVLLALAGAAGCGEHEAEDEFARRTITVKEVPANVLESAGKELPGVDFNEAWKNVEADGALHSYEIRGRNAAGKVREVRVAADGKILEVE